MTGVVCHPMIDLVFGNSELGSSVQNGERDPSTAPRMTIMVRLGFEPGLSQRSDVAGI